MDKTLEKAQVEVQTEEAVVQVVTDEPSELSLRSVAKVKARLRAYESVYDNYQGFIKSMSTKLKADEFKDNSFKELGVARLIAAWIVDTELFLAENEEYLYGVERETRGKFVEESLHDFPDDIKDGLLDKLKERKHELLEWFAKELVLAQKEVSERKKKGLTSY